MKVLFIFGGLPHYYNSILNLVNENPDVDVIVLKPKEKSGTIGEGVYETEEKINFDIISVNEKKGWWGKPIFKNLSKHLASINPDAVVVIWPYILQFLFDHKTINLIKKNKIKLIYKDIPFRIPNWNDVLKYHGEDFFDENMNITKGTGFFPMIKRILLGYIRRTYLRKVNAHVYYTNDAFNIISSYGVDKEKIFIIYNSPDTSTLFESFERAKNKKPYLSPAKFRIVHSGRLVKWKRVDLLVEAVKLLNTEFPELELVIIGSGLEKDNLKSMVENFGLAHKVKFLGSIYSPDILANIYYHSSIYVLAGMGGLSINEAMCFEKPIIVSKCDGTEKMLVREGYNGFYFREGSAEDLAEKIKILLKNPNLIKEMGSNSKSIIRNEINEKVVVNGYLNAFNYVAGSK
ncbi:MAG: glycosyltransferase family 4 protein [Melioribacteraceae bacterium]|nr:glycosyltransferase family 4 protein [Melioribacteraceae bacterium]